ncbi:MAG: bifunctional nuclease family protein [Deltaproteobacteria bacterium]|nr:bifunctional nuclease family protein [Deltaproteobacteria bacterium]
MYRLMKVAGLAVDPFSNSPIMVLKDEETEESLPIWIGLLEATAIASELEEIKYSRPMTHDLFKSVLVQTGATLKRIEVCDLKDNTFFALLQLQKGEEEMTVDARPSDAVALALRFKAPIYVSEEVLQKSKSADGQVPGRPVDKSEEGKKWADILENLDPDDFGKYKM